MNLSDIRLNYAKGALNEQSVGNDPFEFFGQWLQQAITSLVSEPTAMVLSTVDKDGRPVSRVVLLKELKDNALVFFTNYHSAKGRQMELNPKVAALFFWHELERQVRINGIVSKIPESESDAYFNSRPRESRIGAIISPQSQPIENREVMENDFNEIMNRGADYPIQRPKHWGGYAITIEEIEFWQGRPGRLHDRIRFRQQKDGSWMKERLAP
ncbi:MAG: pyridoxamine 5'-phosphate oxidase [Lentimicrobium sp.]|jgi:pyridoxamine 5'-phosphate oxidase|nr:pyridoxamine 5'-phosphate oxidase [Lentimicrobium sp.]MDD2526706.1 pyridoxamine 5'-phosphate oxidase [Lentimicrobiaceae bacterium]MDD4596430.1 pyridoxamine 5'-phosphate oxidase [Lentimicrobiaceae bacterium]MDY0024672.1 pyridoxamine 5'-phosphate oxidase [Lentimicrobium sp.]HAH57316.1 pyridoxamine 5'-phosphate oxidase [Bacteroidales bacterium]